MQIDRVEIDPEELADSLIRIKYPSLEKCTDPLPKWAQALKEKYIQTILLCADPQQEENPPNK